MYRLLAVSVLLLSPSLAGAAPRTLIVVIDAGHGGTNHGAQGVTGALEKAVTLKAARMMKTLLEQRSGVRVVLTRSSDQFLSLSERVRRANRAGGHLFISLHCNASPTHTQQGYEAFVLSPKGFANQIRPGLNEARLTVGSLLHPPWARRHLIYSTLQDLHSRSLRRRSITLGRAVIDALSQTLGAAHNRGLQQAAFDVLSGLKMPASLIEMGFIDHPVQGRRLATTAYLKKVTKALVEAVGRFARQSRGTLPGRAAGPRFQPEAPTRVRRDRRRPDPTQPDPKRLQEKPEVALDITT